MGDRIQETGGHRFTRPEDWRLCPICHGKGKTRKGKKTCWRCEGVGEVKMVE